MGVTRGGNRYLEYDEQTGTTDASAEFVHDLTTRQRTFAHSTENGYSTRSPAAGAWLCPRPGP